MPNGKPGDHPLTEMSKHGLVVYGGEIDALLVEISAPSAGDAFEQWWEREIARETDSRVMRERARARLAALTSRAP